MNRAAITAARFAVSSLGLAALAVSATVMLAPREPLAVARFVTPAPVIREAPVVALHVVPPTRRDVGCVFYEAGLMHPDLPTATVDIALPRASTGLHKAIIKRYVKRQLAKIGFCYKREQIRKPGTVRIDFVIAADGTVSQSTGRGIDPGVASCVAGVVMMIRFPKPTNGGNVKVSYPLKFHPAVQQ